MAKVPNLSVLALPLLLLQMALLAHSTQSISCSKQSTLPLLDYTISSTFIWLPSDANANEITQTLRNAIYQALKAETNPTSSPSSSPSSKTSSSPQQTHPPSTPIRATITNFLDTQCTLHLTVIPAPFVHASASLSLLNETLQDTDLLCRLATHKIGKTYTENPHIMMTSHFRATVQYPRDKTKSTKPKPNIKEKTELPPQSPGLEYRLQCPHTKPNNPQPQQQKPGPGPPPAPLSPLEGLTGTAYMKDCEWCKMIGRQLDGICLVGNGPTLVNDTSANGSISSDSATGQPATTTSPVTEHEPMNNDPTAIAGLAELVRGAGWAFGGTNCLECS